MKLTIDLNVNLNHTQESEILKILNQILKQNQNIMGALDDVKAALATSNEKIDIIVPALTGVAKDVAFIKAKLEANAGGIDAAGVAELLGIITPQNEKLSQVATDIKALDDSTNSDEA